MEKRVYSFGTSAKLIIAAALAAFTTQAASAEELLVSAAISLKEVLATIKSEFEGSHPGSKIYFNFAASGQLARQLEQGANADVFIAASIDQMNDLKKRNLIVAQSMRNVASNTLVVVVPKIAKCVDDLKALSTLQRITIGDPLLVPAGSYAKEALTAAGLYNTLSASHKLVFAESARQAVAYVQTGNVDAGIVYSTETNATANIKTCMRIPKTMTSPIVYCAAVTESSQHKRLANQFLQALTDPAATHAFKSQGFEPPP